MGEKTTDVRPRPGPAPGTTQPAEFAKSADPEIASIRTDIERTRAEMSETISTIQEKLSVQQLGEQLFDKLRETVNSERTKQMMEKTSYRVREMGNSIGETIKDHPVPMAMLALGLGWLLMESKKGSGGQYYAEYGYPEGEYLGEEEYLTGTEEFDTGAGYYRTGTHGYYGKEGSRGSRWKGSAESARKRAEQYTGQAREKAGEYGSEVRHKAQEYGSEVRHKAQEYGAEARHKAQHFAEEARHRAHDFSEQARHRTSEMSARAQQSARQATRKLNEVREHHPLSMLGAAFAIGALFGLLVPETRKEQELMGETRDDLVGRAQEYGRETLEKVEHVAEEAKRAAKEEAERQDLTAEKMEKKVESVATEAKEAAKDTAKKEDFSSTI
jgi:ElaB/YqjD/DUF883 family membrane-anchored ribosome-binding protein